MTNKKIFQKDKKSIDFGPRIVYNIDSSKEHHKQVKEITTMTTIYTLFTEQVINATESIMLTMDNDINLDETVIDETYEELAPFVSKINLQKRKIDRQIAELSRSRREFETIAENMSEGLLLTDIKGYILTHNSSIKKFFGVQEDINGKNNFLVSPQFKVPPLIPTNSSSVIPSIYSKIT